MVIHFQAIKNLIDFTLKCQCHSGGQNFQFWSSPSYWQILLHLKGKDNWKMVPSEHLFNNKKVVIEVFRHPESKYGLYLFKMTSVTEDYSDIPCRNSWQFFCQFLTHVKFSVKTRQSGVQKLVQARVCSHRSRLFVTGKSHTGSYRNHQLFHQITLYWESASFLEYVVAFQK